MFLRPSSCSTLLLCLGQTVSQQVEANTASCENACNFLRDKQLLGATSRLPALDNSQLPDFQQDLLLSDSESSRPLFWAQQQSSTQPACYVRASSKEDIVSVLSASRDSGCPFAVRGGGHSDIYGASNSPGGITIDLSGLNEIEIVESENLARVGAGLTWGTVYSELEKRNLTVVGGRLTSVGVGGLTLGGGLSHFSGMHGWACDNVKSFEIVLANGSVIEASASTHPDLHRALRGGGNNFGVVTRFDLTTYKQGPMWGGLHVWPYQPQVTSAITSAFLDFAHESPSDPHVSVFAGLGYKMGLFAWAAGLYDSLGREQAPIFERFVDNEETIGTTKMMTTARITSLSDLADELDKSEPAGIRSRFTTATFKADKELLQLMVDVFVHEVNKALDDGLKEDERFAPMLGIQPLTRNFLEESQKNGGNVMGLDVEDAPMIVCSFGWEWSRESDDEVVIRGIKAVHDQSVVAAKQRGLYRPFKYMNYAAADQDPIRSYGSESVAFLKKVKQFYDPEGVFSKLVPGGFKIF